MDYSTLVYIRIGDTIKMMLCPTCDGEGNMKSSTDSAWRLIVCVASASTTDGMSLDITCSSENDDSGLDKSGKVGSRGKTRLLMGKLHEENQNNILSTHFNYLYLPIPGHYA
jgi:hypothetical protein